MMPARRPFALGRCACGALVRPDSFRARAAYLDFTRDGRCLACRDKAILTEATACVPPGRGAVAARSIGDGDALMAAFIPFLFTHPGAFAAWDTPNICCFGPGTGASDAWDELSSMSVPLDGHRVRIRKCIEFDALRVADSLGALDLLIAVDGVEAHALAAHSGIARSAVLLGLAEAFDWSEAYGLALHPLPPFALHAGFELWCPDMHMEVTALRMCAWLGAALSLPALKAGRARLTVMDWLLSRHRASLGERV